MLENYKRIVSDFKEFFNTAPVKVNGLKTSTLLSYSVPIPDIKLKEMLNSNLIDKEDLFYWNIRDEKIEFLALQPLQNYKEFGEKRFENTCLKLNAFENKFYCNWEKNGLDFIPLIVGGIKFAPDQHSELWKDFSDSDWFIPKIILFRNNGSFFLIYNFFYSDDFNKIASDFEDTLEYLKFFYNLKPIENKISRIKAIVSGQSRKNWKKIVDEALFNITEGLMTKVVLSREVNYALMDKPNVGYFAEMLSERYPKCYTFIFKRNKSVFLGASPEKLAKISDNWIEVDALAGSMPRGNNKSEDIELENSLLSSEKNLFEQRAVVNFIHNLLSKFSDEIIFDDKPKVRKLPNIQHLWTIIKAKLNSDFKVLNMLMKLHPTPAICGTPWRIAKDFILEIEPHDRGLYSGNIGWFNFNGSGEFAVGIRTALLKEDKLYAYAGCGIVEGSEATAEYEESEIKLKPILSLFVDEEIYQS